MGYYCTVPQCTSLAGKTKNVKFHRFPRDTALADKWNVILKRGKPYTKYSKVCSLHFTQADYNVTTMGQWKTLSKDAVPTQNLPKLNPDGTVMVIRKSRTVKYREIKKEDNNCDKSERWTSTPVHHQVLSQDTQPLQCTDQHDVNLAYRLQNLNAIANNISPQYAQSRPLEIPQSHPVRPKKQDAIMQTDPEQYEDEESQQNATFNEVSEKDYTNYQAYKKEDYEPKKYESRDYRKSTEDYIPQTNEEYNKEAEKYALERKTHYDKIDYQKQIDSGYGKLGDIYPTFDKYPRQDYPYQDACQDSVEMLRNQQHNLQMLQEQHRINENQNFFNENQIKQEIDVQLEDDKYLYERTKDQLADGTTMYAEGQRRLMQQQRILEHIQQQVKQEPEANSCESVLQPQTSPYYPQNGHENVASGYYEQVSRPGPELLIAKQNALAAHTQLWQNTMKRPFFYSENPPYNGSQLLHRFEDLTRILQ